MFVNQTRRRTCVVVGSLIFIRFYSPSPPRISSLVPSGLFLSPTTPSWLSPLSNGPNHVDSPSNAHGISCKSPEQSGSAGTMLAVSVHFPERGCCSSQRTKCRPFGQRRFGCEPHLAAARVASRAVIMMVRETRIVNARACSC